MNLGQVLKLAAFYNCSEKEIIEAQLNSIRIGSNLKGSQT